MHAIKTIPMQAQLLCQGHEQNRLMKQVPGPARLIGLISRGHPLMLLPHCSMVLQSCRLPARRVGTDAALVLTLVGPLQLGGLK